MTPRQEYIQVSIWRRLLVSVGYILATVVLSLLLLRLFTSAQCYAGSDCDQIEQLIYAIVSLADFMLGLLWLALGSQGVLPGARRRLVN